MPLVPTAGHPSTVTRGSKRFAWLRSPWVVVTVLLLFSHSWLLREALQNGDGAVYNDQIEQRILAMRTTHVGYMLLGISANTILPFDVERNMNIMCLAFAAVGGAALFRIAQSLGASRGVAAMAPLLALGIGAYLRGAVLAEVDVVACSLILVAIALWLDGRVAAAGGAFGLATLVTPITALSLPLVIFTPRRRRGAPKRWTGHLRDVALFGGVALACYLPLVGFFWHDYWYGGRGLLHAPREVWDVRQQIARSIAFLGSSASQWLWLALAATLAGIVSGAPLSVGVAAALVVAGSVGERFLDVPVQLPQLCVLAAFAVVLVGRLPTRGLRWSALLILWAATAWPTYSKVAEEVREDVDNRETYRAMAEQTPKMILAGVPDSWDDGLRFERIVYRRTKLGLGMSFRDLRNSSQTIVERRPDYAIWLVGRAPAGVMASFVRNWRQERRTVRGREYEVWLPSGG
jgi:hypothetical protein